MPNKCLRIASRDISIKYRCALTGVDFPNSGSHWPNSFSENQWGMVETAWVPEPAKSSGRQRRQRGAFVSIVFGGPGSITIVARVAAEPTNLGFIQVHLNISKRIDVKDDEEAMKWHSLAVENRHWKEREKKIVPKLFPTNGSPVAFIKYAYVEDPAHTMFTFKGILAKREITPLLGKLAFDVLKIFDATPMLLVNHCVFCKISTCRISVWILLISVGIQYMYISGIMWWISGWIFGISQDICKCDTPAIRWWISGWIFGISQDNCKCDTPTIRWWIPGWIVPISEGIHRHIFKISTDKLPTGGYWEHQLMDILVALGTRVHPAITAPIPPSVPPLACYRSPPVVYTIRLHPSFTPWLIMPNK
ncbi:hypothetical protein B0H11DRAFT_1922086 [Mycena galericulata]|nr:hypothetical protein B0H11DRAFT_1922086 [Mycena galericulata]